MAILGEDALPVVFAACSKDLPPGSHLRCDAAGQPVLLARLGDGLHAVHDTCLHRGASLSASPVQDGVVTCHLHFWSFDVRSGACLQVPGLKLRTFVVFEEEGNIYVET
jgi:nitrite reductase/ring-hydroxylating ferredoxin subunit